MVEFYSAWIGAVEDFGGSVGLLLPSVWTRHPPLCCDTIEEG